MRGVIWSCDRTGDGVEKLKYIQDRYLQSGINPIKEVYSHSGSWIEFENGDNWRVASVCESSRGNRSNVALIDSRVDENFFRSVILPTLTINPRHYEFFMPRGDN